MSPKKPKQPTATSGTGHLKHISHYLGRPSKLPRPVQPKKNTEQRKKD